MNNLKKSHDSVRQNEKNVQKSQKHDANLQKNSTLYFQVGLILCLLASYGALEMSFASAGNNYTPPMEIADEDYVYVMPDFVIEKVEEPEVEQKKQQPKPKDPELKIVDNTTKEKELIDKIVKVVVPVNKKVAISIEDPSLDVEPVEEPVNILAVQKVPIYPGCEKETNNVDRRKCMSNKLGKLIQRKFDTEIASELGLSGKQQIFVSFKINKQGEVEILKTRAPHRLLDKEAKRVVGKIPTMQPGKNDNNPVEVLYMLPIKFDIR